MKKKIDFVKAHAGWDEAIFLYGDQVPEGKELEIGLSLLKRPSLRGTELGVLYEPQEGGDIKVKMLDATSNAFISMCGGLTQSLGKAVVETDIGKRFNIKTQGSRTEFVLETEAGFIPVRVDVSNGTAQKVTTNMRSYVRYCYGYGVRDVKIRNINAVGVGLNPPRMELLVVNVDEIKKEYPEANVWAKNTSTLNILKRLYEDFIEDENLGGPSLYSVLYDMHPEGKGKARYVYRPFPTMYEEIGEDIEMACGTGVTAVGIAMLENGDVNVNDGAAEILFEVGSKSIVSKPQQVETELRMRINNGKVVDAEFSHSLIEIIACGKAYISTRI